MNTFVVIPAMNEAKSIEKVVADLVRNKYQVVVVNDASIDDTAAIAKKAGATVLSNIKNLGAWKATQAGIRYAYQNGADLVITMDADGQHSVDQISELVHEYAKGADVVIGSCMKRGSKGRHIAWSFFKLVNRLKVSDITSGFRLYNRKSMFGLISKQATMLEYQCVGVLILLRNMKLNIVETSVIMNDRTDGISRIFYSWGAVFYYLMYSVLLSITKAFPTRVGKFIKNINH